jgi:hypothetical protein
MRSPQFEALNDNSIPKLARDEAVRVATTVEVPPSSGPPSRTTSDKSLLRDRPAHHGGQRLTAE